MSKQKKNLLFLWTFLLLLFRPSVLGEKFNIIIFFLFCITSALLFLIDSNQVSNYKINTNRFIVISILLLLIFYLFVQGVIISHATKTVVNSCVFITGVGICILLILNEKNTSRIIYSFISIHYILSVSILITYFLVLLWKMGIINVPHIANLNFLIPGYKRSEALFSSHELFFPSTILWSTTNFFGLQLPRCVGLYREPGMAQVFFLTAYFFTFLFPVVEIKRKRNIILIGSAFLFSSGWLLSFCIGYILFYIFNKLEKRYLTIKHLSFLLITSLLIFAILYIPNIGLSNKIETVSAKERLHTLPHFYEYFNKSPIYGDGYYNGFDDNKGNMRSAADKDFPGILMFVYQTGLIGLLLYLFLWYFGLFKLGNAKTIFIYVPCLITLLTSQPIYNDAIVWFLILLDTNKKKIYF